MKILKASKSRGEGWLSRLDQLRLDKSVLMRHLAAALHNNNNNNLPMRVENKL